MKKFHTKKELQYIYDSCKGTKESDTKKGQQKVESISVKLSEPDPLNNMVPITYPMPTATTPLVTNIIYTANPSVTICNIMKDYLRRIVVDTSIDSPNNYYDYNQLLIICSVLQSDLFNNMLKEVSVNKNKPYLIKIDPSTRKNIPDWIDIIYKVADTKEAIVFSLRSTPINNTNSLLGIKMQRATIE